jgi:hypothetical protein
MLSERSRLQKTTYYIIPLYELSRIDKYMEWQISWVILILTLEMTCLQSIEIV